MKQRLFSSLLFFIPCLFFSHKARPHASTPRSLRTFQVTIHLVTNGHYPAVRRIEPVAFISAAFTVAKLFFGTGAGDSGPTMADFAQNLSGQIEDLNTKLDLIVGQLDMIQYELVKLPAVIVSKLKQQELQGAIYRYQSVIKGLSAPKYDGDIEAFMGDEANVEAVKELTKDLRRIKAELGKIDDPALVPFVALAVQAEYTLRLHFSQEPLETMVGFMEDDRNYLHRNTFGKGVSLKTQLRDLQRNWDSMIVVTHHRYIARIDENIEHRGYWAPVERYLEYYGASSPFVKDTFLATLEEMVALKKLGILRDNVNPIAFSFPAPEHTVFSTGSGRNREYYSKHDFFWDHTRPIAEREQQLYSAIKEIFTQQNLRLEQHYFALGATAAAYFSGINVIEYLNAYINATSIK